MASSKRQSTAYTPYVYSLYQYPSAVPYHPQPPHVQSLHAHAYCDQPHYASQPPPLGPMYGLQAPTLRRTFARGIYSGGIIAASPLPEDTPDPTLERLTQQGLTPAQAYRAHHQRIPHIQRPFELPVVEVIPELLISGPRDHERDDVRDLGVAQLAYPSPPISNASVDPNPSGSQQSIESVRTAPVGNGGGTGRRRHTYSGSTASSARAWLPIPQSQQQHASRRRPLVYPALLSCVSDVFCQRIPLGDHHKDGLTYSAAFTGREAVDLIAYIIKTSDRNLALLLGRALDAQKLFYDVTYNHRLRDSPAKVYRFSDTRPVTLWDTGAEDESTPVRLGLLSAGQESGSGSANAGGHVTNDKDADLLLVGVFTLLTDCYSPTCSSDRLCYSSLCPRRLEQVTRQQSRRPQLANTPATPDPTSSRKLKSNSSRHAKRPFELPFGAPIVEATPEPPISSPGDYERRDNYVRSDDNRARDWTDSRHSQNRPNQSPRPGASTFKGPIDNVWVGSFDVKGGSIGLCMALGGAVAPRIAHGTKFEEPSLLWVHSVPNRVVDSVSDQEKKRQEAIKKIIDTERDFVRDLEYLQDRWMEPLRTGDIISPDRREDFVQQVFWNIEDILDVNKQLSDLLTERQDAHPIVETIGDIFNKMVPHFGPFVLYGKDYLYARYEFESEKSKNRRFSAFVETVEQLPDSRKLGLDVYLIKPIARLARYLPMLSAVLEHTPENNPDRASIPKVVELIRAFLTKLDEESGKTENRLNLLQLDKRLVFGHREEVDLKLREEHRQLVYKGSLTRRGGSANENGDLQIFLFDHALLMVKSKMVGKHEQLKVHKRPIPLELLLVSVPHKNAYEDARLRAMLTQPILNGAASNSTPPFAAPRPNSQKNGYQLTITYLGRKGYSITLWAPTFAVQKKWVEQIKGQQDAMCEQSKIFDTYLLNEGVFMSDTRVNCAVPYDNGRRLAYGTDDGVYFQTLHDGQLGYPTRKLQLTNVQQIDVLEDYQLLVVLAEREVLTFPLDTIEEGQYPMKRMKRIASHTSFFKAGYCLGRTLVCVVKASSLGSTIKIFEPIDQVVRGMGKPIFKKLHQGANDMLKVFKEFYIPNEAQSIHFLKTKLCVACSMGFEIVDLETLDTQALLDPVDMSLDFVKCHESARPVSIYRIDGEFLLCYTDFAFFVNKSGRRSKKDIIIHWEGTPTSFALHHPYVMAFDPTFIEIWHVEDGALVQVIHGSNLRLLFADGQPSVMNWAASSWLASSSQYQCLHTHSYGGRTPYGRYSQSSTHGHAQSMSPRAQQLMQRRAHIRDEIVLVSNDTVMSMRLALPPRSSIASTTGRE